MMEQKQFFELADKLKEARDQKRDLEAQVKELNVQIESLDTMLSDAMAEAECDRFSRNGATFYLNSRLFASAQAGRRDVLIQTLKDKGYGSLVSETVNANTLASFCREQMAANDDELPDWLKDVVSTFDKVSVGIRKS